MAAAQAASLQERRAFLVRGRHLPSVEVHLLTPRLSAPWLELVTRADFSLARALVLGLGEDLLPEDEGFWERIGHTALVPFDVAARRALAEEPRPAGAWQWLGRMEEQLVDRTARRSRR
ncbi:MAG: hypothetical protein ACOCV4_02980 [Myxococcota bacterium]